MPKKKGRTQKKKGRTERKRRGKDFKRKQDLRRLEDKIKEYQAASSRYATTVATLKPFWTTLMLAGGVPGLDRNPHEASIAVFFDPTAPAGMFREDMDFYLDTDKIAEYELTDKGLKKPALRYFKSFFN